MFGSVPRLRQRHQEVERASPVWRKRARFVTRGHRSGLTRRLTRREQLPLLALAGVVLGTVVLLGRLAVANHYVFADEANAILFGRSIAVDPSLAYTGSLGRGPERLTSLITALIAGTSDSSSQQLWLLHAVMATCQGLVAVPAWLAARELGLDRWPAVLPAAIAATGSFAMYGIFTLNQAVGLLFATTMLWAMVRALRRPGISSDLLVLAALGATALARIGWAPLVIALVPGTLASAWLERPVGERLGRYLRTLTPRLMRRHPLLVPVFVVGLVVAILLGPSSLLGGVYGGEALGHHLQLSILWDNARRFLSHLALALALVPFMLAIPLLARDLFRPADATSGGFAWLVLGLLVVFSWIHYGALPEDRYLAVLGPPFALAAGLAVFRRPAPVWAVLVSGLLTARLVATSYSWPTEGPFDFFTAPSSLFFHRVVVGELWDLLPFSPPHIPTIALITALGAALIVAVAVRMPHPRKPLATATATFVLVGVLAYQVVAADYPARKFVQAVGMTEVPAAELSFIDTAARGGRAEPLAVDGVVDPDLAAQLGFLRVYNRTLGGGIPIIRGPRPPDADASAPAVFVDWKTGRADVTGTPPEVLLQKPGFNAVGLSGGFFPPSPYYSFAALQRLRRPIEALWMVRGDSIQGYPARGQPLELRVFPPTHRMTCVRGAVSINGLVDRPSRYRLAGGMRTVRGVGQPATAEHFAVRVRGGLPTTLVLRGDAGQLPDGNWVGPTLVNLSVAECS